MHERAISRARIYLPIAMPIHIEVNCFIVFCIVFFRYRRNRDTGTAGIPPRAAGRVPQGASRMRQVSMQFQKEQSELTPLGCLVAV